MFQAQIHKPGVSFLFLCRRKPGTISQGRPMKAKVSRGLTPTALLPRNSQSRKIPSVRRARNFFSMVSCKIFIPGMASGYIFLSPAFSFSRACFSFVCSFFFDLDFTKSSHLTWTIFSDGGQLKTESMNGPPPENGHGTT